LLTTTAMLLLGGIASLLAALYETSATLTQAGDVVLALGATASLVYSRNLKRH
jgi:hypothetical protein